MKHFFYDQGFTVVPKPTTVPTKPAGPSGPTTNPAATTSPSKGM